jgi:hypothetical protein
MTVEQLDHIAVVVTADGSRIAVPAQGKPTTADGRPMSAGTLSSQQMNEVIEWARKAAQTGACPSSNSAGKM